MKHSFLRCLSLCAGLFLLGFSVAVVWGARLARQDAEMRLSTGDLPGGSG